MNESKPFDYWERFAEEAREAGAPLYAKLARGIAADAGLRAFANSVREGQPPANVLFAAVHYLLLRGADHPLRRFYRNLNGGERIEGSDPYPPFGDFVDRHRSALAPLVASRATNTNEAGRSALLHAGFRVVASESGEPLHLIELGPSAGLNLIWDKYRVRYFRKGEAFEAGPTGPALTIPCALRGAMVPPLGPSPRIAGRVGLERNPVDLSDPDQRDWLKALIWPDHAKRFARLETAIATFRESPADIRRGDALALLPDAIAEIPENRPICVYHTAVTYQFSEKARRALDDMLVAVGQRRPIWRLNCEGDPARAGEMRMTLGRYRGGAKQARTIAACQPHGAWMEWRG